MKLFVNIKQLSPSFNKEYADDYHQGQQTSGNIKYMIDKSFVVEDVDSIKVDNSVDYKMSGKTQTGETKTLHFSSMTVLNCIKNDSLLASFAVSKNLLQRIQKTPAPKYDILRFYFYLKPKEVFVQASNGVYVLRDEWPNELV